MDAVKMLKSRGFTVSSPRKSKYYEESRTVKRDDSKCTLVKLRGQYNTYQIMPSADIGDIDPLLQKDILELAETYSMNISFSRY